MNLSIVQFLDEAKIEYVQNALMSDNTSFKIGGPADFLCLPQKVEQLKSLLKFCRENDVPYFVLGNGSNLLVSDLGIEGIVISLKHFNDISYNPAYEITCGAGIKLSKLCSFALENSLSGLEFAWGIPGTVGGAIYMNAGAYGGEISFVLKECTFIDEEGNVVQADLSSLQLGYRKSIFTDSKKVIISATFKLKNDRKENIRAVMDDLIERRRTKQPLEFPSAGSTFKRPTGHFAGALIEECGLKGTQIGGAQVSEKHAGFVINTGDATCSDVLSLISKIKQEVYLQTSVTLEPEVKAVGRFGI